MTSVLFNGTNLYVCKDSKWDSSQIKTWIMNAVDTDPSNVDKYLEERDIFRVNMSMFNYFPTQK